MENNKQGKKWYTKVSVALPNLYYVGTLVSLIFILAQVFYAKRSIVESSEWEKAKMTIENIERFKLELDKSPLATVWMHGDKLFPDFSTPKGWSSPHRDTLLSIYRSLFDDGIKDKEEVRKEAKEEIERMIDVMNTFAYPIIMGYASEMGSNQNVGRQYYTYGAFIMPIAFREYPNLGSHAKLLYRLWRIRFELMVVNNNSMYPNDKYYFEYIEKNVDNLPLLVR